MPQVRDHLGEHFTKHLIIIDDQYVSHKDIPLKLAVAGLKRQLHRGQQPEISSARLGRG
jgi:hypothetical protein